MFILNAGLSHKSKDWLMNSTTEICEDKERVKLRKEMLVQSKLEHCSVFGPYLEFYMSKWSQMFTQTWWDIGLQLSCEHKNLTMPFSSPNHSNNGEVQICLTTRTLFSVWPISGVLEVQMTSTFFCLESWVNFLQLSCLLEDPVQMVAFLFYSDKKIRIFTKSKVGHLLNN